MIDGKRWRSVGWTTSKDKYHDKFVEDFRRKGYFVRTFEATANNPIIFGKARKGRPPKGYVTYVRKEY